MNKKYKHIPTGIILVEYREGKYVEEGKTIAFPEKFICGKDWEELKDTYIGEKCNKVQKRMECLACHYPYSEASLPDDGSLHFKVEDKPEWTILSFKVDWLKPEGILTLQKDGIYSVGCWSASLKSLMIDTNSRIHSVRRESDSEVFSLGDTIQHVDDPHAKVPHIITGFEIVSGELLVYGLVNGKVSTNYGINKCVKIKTKEWTIISIKHPVHMHLYDKPNITAFLSGNDDGGKWVIYSVRRESDCEVFTLKDSYTHYSFSDEIYTIDRFHVDAYGKMFVNPPNCKTNVHSRLDNISKTKPKEWEITSFVERFNGFDSIPVERIYSKHKQVFALGMVSFTEKELLELPYFHIQSVKRLSDGVEFKIGDKIRLKHNNHVRAIVAIKEEFGELRLRTDTGHIAIQNAFKIEKILTMENGVDIYKGDKIYGVSDWKVWEKIVEDNDITPITWWSKRELAEEFILLNKPCLSYNDVEEAQRITHSNSFNGVEPFNFREHLKELVKSKI